MKLLILDNYDSFTFNLYQDCGRILSQGGRKFEVVVKRNDEITLEQITKCGFDAIIISPGPGDPSQRSYFGVCADVLCQLAKRIPILGVCLGMQGMAHYYGGKVVRALLPMHGKTSLIEHDGKGVFHGLPQDLEIMRYHSLIVERKSLPTCFEISASTKNGRDAEIMGLRHKEFPLEGIQFHPESFATEGGRIILENFLDRV